MGILDLAGDLLDVISNPFGETRQGHWNITEGSFTQDVSGERVVFLFDETAARARKEAAQENSQQKTAISTITDTGGRRKVIYEYPYRNGQRVRDLGRRGESFALNVMFHGPQYQTLFNRFIRVCVNGKESGVFSHPVRGSLRGAFQGYEFVHDHSASNAVAIRCTFIEDSSDDLATLQAEKNAPDSVIRQGLSILTTVQQKVTQAIDLVEFAQTAPKAALDLLRTRLDNIVASTSILLGKLASTFGTDVQLKALAGQAQAAAIPITSLTAGISENAVLPAVFQVGMVAEAAALLDAQTAAFVGASQVTTSQAIFQANAIRLSLAAGIQEAEDNLGNEGAEIVLQYRTLAVQIQDTVEASISAAKLRVRTYTTPYNMSLRQVAFNNGLSPDRQNDLSDLNPTLFSVNFVAEGTVLTVPVS